ncbi:MAG: hypothetical protein AAF741_08265 [Bacteroidota bacterium]
MKNTTSIALLIFSLLEVVAYGQNVEIVHGNANRTRASSPDAFDFIDEG